MSLLLSFEFVDDTVQRFKALVPHLAVTRDPLQLLFETARADAARAHAADLFGGHEAGQLERADVFLHAREGHFELVGEFGDGGVAASKLAEDATTGGIGEGGESSVEACRKTLNHTVQCIAVGGGHARDVSSPSAHVIEPTFIDEVCAADHRQDKRHPKGRSVGIFVDGGSDARTIQSLCKAAEHAGAMVKFVAPKGPRPTIPRYCFHR